MENVAEVYLVRSPSDHSEELIASVTTEDDSRIEVIPRHDDPEANWRELSKVIPEGYYVLINGFMIDPLIDITTLEASGKAFLHKSLAPPLELDSYVHEVARLSPESKIQVYDVGTDASASRRLREGVFWGAVVHDRQSPDKPDRPLWGKTKVFTVNEGEVVAISRVMKMYPRARLHVRTDSMTAYRLIHGTIASTGAITPLVQEIRRHMRANGSTVVWVKGHRDDSLNDRADRIAVTARRHHHEGINHEKTKKVMTDIANDSAGEGRSRGKSVVA